MTHRAPDLPESIDTSRGVWSWNSHKIAQTVNKLFPVLRWLIAIVEMIPNIVDNMRSIAAEQQTQRNRMAVLEKQVADLRDLDRPRIIFKAGRAVEKPVGD